MRLHITLCFLALSSSLMALDREEQACIFCSTLEHKSYSLRNFRCDEPNDADRQEKCIFCDQQLGVGKNIGKIICNDQYSYFHHPCLENAPPLCLSCKESLLGKIYLQETFDSIKTGTIKYLGIACKCIAGFTVTGLALYLTYYFSMGPGSSHYCPCFIGISGEDSCREAYEGCSFNIK